MTYSFKPVQIPGDFGFGTMSLTWTPKPPATSQSVATLKHAAFKRNMRFINGGEFYGPDYANVKLLQEFVNLNTDEENQSLVISIKGGFDAQAFSPNGSREFVQKSLDETLSFFPLDPAKRPKLVYEVARVDPRVPYEQSIEAIAEYVEQGKIDGVLLSEVGIGLIQKALSVCAVSCVELELSLVCQDIISNGILAELSKHKVSVVAYSPLGRGLLTDSTSKDPQKFYDSIDVGDIRHKIDKFSPQNFAHNAVLVQKLAQYAREQKQTLLENLALAWILAISGRAHYKGIENVSRILPIPSGLTPEKVDRNVLHIVSLSDSDLVAIDAICTDHPIKGLRYDKRHQALLNA